MTLPNKKITPAQSGKLHTLLSQMGLMEQKKEMLLNYTNGRTSSARELTMDEARDIISQLCANDPRHSHIKAIWMLAYRAGIIWGDTSEDNQINAAKLDLFLKEKGTVKKGLRNMTLDEIKKVHRQFEAIVRNTAAGRAKKATDGLLQELGITKSQR